MSQYHTPDAPLYFLTSLLVFHGTQNSLYKYITIRENLKKVEALGSISILEKSFFRRSTYIY